MEKDIHSVVTQMMKDIVTEDFLSNVKQCADYTGDKFWLGDMDLSIENLGVWEIKTMTPKLIFDNNGNFTVSKTEEREHITKYNVSKVRNISVCSDYNTRILISKVKEEYDRDSLELFIYSVNENEETADNSQYTKLPSLERLKKDFENKNYKPYLSLLHNFCGEYSLQGYNDTSDRIRCFTSLAMDLEWIVNSKEEDKDFNI